MLLGVAQGDGTRCSTVDCPEPTGAPASRTASASCSRKRMRTSQALCGKVPARPARPCANGAADACEAPAIPVDIDGNGAANGAEPVTLLVN